jgi:hypothetical protein
MTEDSNFKDKGPSLLISMISGMIFSIGFFCGLLTIGYDVFVWLKTGEWMNTPFYSVFIWLNIDPFTPVHNISWQGIKKILLWFLEMPLFLMFMILGAALGGLFYLLFTQNDE